MISTLCWFDTHRNHISAWPEAIRDICQCTRTSRTGPYWWVMLWNICFKYWMIEPQGCDGAHSSRFVLSLRVPVHLEGNVMCGAKKQEVSNINRLPGQFLRTSHHRSPLMWQTPPRPQAPCLGADHRPAKRRCELTVGIVLCMHLLWIAGRVETGAKSEAYATSWQRLGLVYDLVPQLVKVAPWHPTETINWKRCWFECFIS